MSHQQQDQQRNYPAKSSPSAELCAMRNSCYPKPPRFAMPCYAIRDNNPKGALMPCSFLSHSQGASVWAASWGCSAPCSHSGTQYTFIQWLHRLLRPGSTYANPLHLTDEERGTVEKIVQDVWGAELEQGPAEIKGDWKM